MSTPKIYVGTYAKYNNGSLKGDWFDLTDYSCLEDLLEDLKEFHDDEEDPELMIQDTEYLPDDISPLSEKAIEYAGEYVKALSDHNEDAFSTYYRHINTSGNYDYQEFLDSYRGEFDSEVDYAMSFVEDCGLLNDVDDALKNYFDYKAYVRDLFMDYTFINGYVFE